MTTPVHLSRSSGNPCCGDRDPAARVTSDHELATCESCRGSAYYLNRVRHAKPRANVGGILAEPIERVSLKRAAWAYGCSKSGSETEARLLALLRAVLKMEDSV